MQQQQQQQQRRQPMLHYLEGMGLSGAPGRTGRPALPSNPKLWTLNPGCVCSPAQPGFASGFDSYAAHCCGAAHLEGMGLSGAPGRTGRPALPSRPWKASSRSPALLSSLSRPSLQHRSLLEVLSQAWNCSRASTCSTACRARSPDCSTHHEHASRLKLQNTTPAQHAAAGTGAAGLSQVQVCELKPGAGLQDLACQGHCIATRASLLQLRRLHAALSATAHTGSQPQILPATTRRRQASQLCRT